MIRGEGEDGSAWILCDVKPGGRGPEAAAVENKEQTKKPAIRKRGYLYVPGYHLWNSTHVLL